MSRVKISLETQFWKQFGPRLHVAYIVPLWCCLTKWSPPQPDNINRWSRRGTFLFWILIGIFCWIQTFRKMLSIFCSVKRIIHYYHYHYCCYHHYCCCYCYYCYCYCCYHYHYRCRYSYRYYIIIVISIIVIIIIIIIIIIINIIIVIIIIIISLSWPFYDNILLALSTAYLFCSSAFYIVISCKKKYLFVIIDQLLAHQPFCSDWKRLLDIKHLLFQFQRPWAPLLKKINWD